MIRTSDLIPVVLLIALCASAPLLAQGSATDYYPAEDLYPGRNVVTITNPHGIDQIRFDATAHTRVEIPSFDGCPTRVDVTVWIDDPTTEERLQLVVYDCNGDFDTKWMRAENWTIVHENLGRVHLGEDTCIQAAVSTTSRHVIDSIVTTNPDVSTVVLTTERPWVADARHPLPYRICFHPQSLGRREAFVRLYVHRTYPNGGLSEYTIDKPVTVEGLPEVVSPPSPILTERPAAPALPPVVDPTTFRTIAMPTGETLAHGRGFVANYDLAGWLAGYGVTDRLMLLGGGAFVPDAISRLRLATLGVKYNVLSAGDLLATVGFQAAISSTSESDISVAAPYLVVSYGDRRNRLTAGIGYSWKHHVTVEGGAFDRNAAAFAVGGDVTIARGWKLAAETYAIESSGILPVMLTARWFGEHHALDFGFVIDVSADNGTSIRGTGLLSGEITNVPLAPVVSFVWVW